LFVLARAGAGERAGRESNKKRKAHSELVTTRYALCVFLSYSLKNHIREHNIPAVDLGFF
jgi:hypothetical protein